MNWWATADTRDAALHAIGPESIFPSANGEPLRIDALATTRFLATLDREKPRFATVYLPALDVILNRVELDPAAKLATSLRALDGIGNAVAQAQARGYEVVLVGMPGEGQRGDAVLASNLPLNATSAWDVAPALLALLGFPASAEMPGGAPQPRVATYGPRDTSPAAAASINEEYYENLKSLGYIR